MSKKKTNEQFLRELEIINPTIHPEEPYINAATKIQCHCLKCGHTWLINPNSLLMGHGCPNCAGNIQKSNSEFTKELSRVNPSIEPLEDYRNNKASILCRCKVCGTVWSAKPHNLICNKTGCPLCSKQQRGNIRKKTNEAFVRELSLLNSNIIPLEPYISSSEKIRCKCKKCGYVWPVAPNQLLSAKSGCPKCDHTNTSVIEQIIAKSFSIGIGESSVLSRDRKAVHRELDVYIPKIQLAIEFGAWFWHKDKLQKDNEKQRLCAEKGIHLVTILEKCPEKINVDLVGDYRIYRENLSAEKDYHSIRAIIQSLFIHYGIPFSDIEEMWDKIVEEAMSCAQRRNNEDFIKLLSKANPTIVLVSEYLRADGKVRCKCSVCGHEWPVFASSLLSGHGCPKCSKTKSAKKRTLTNEEFLSRLSEVNSTIKPLEPYKKSNVAILCKCNKCGNIWPARPNNLLLGKGCRKCAIMQQSSLRSKPIRCIETGVCYSSIAEVRRMGIYNVIKCLKGSQKTAGGYHWEYVEE